MPSRARVVSVVGLGWILCTVLVAGARPALAHAAQEEQLRELTRRLAENPQDPWLYLRRGDLYREQGLWDAALADYERAGRIDPDLALRARAELWLTAGRPELAETSLGPYLSRHPEDRRAWLTRARARRRLGRTDAAADYARALELMPNPGPGEVVEAARALAAAGEVEEALHRLDEARARLGPLTVLERAAIALDLERGDADAALKRLEGLAAATPHGELWRAWRGEILEQQGHRRLARRAYQEALEELQSRPPNRRSGGPLVDLERRLHLALARLEDSQGGRGATVADGWWLDGPPVAGWRAGGSVPDRAIPATVAAAGVASAADAQSGARVVRGPYLQTMTPTRVTVRWRTDLPTDSRVRYGHRPDELTSAADGAPATREHEVTVADLEAGARYFYSVGTPGSTLAGGDGEHSFLTAPQPGNRKRTRVWVVGDSGTANLDARAVRRGFEVFGGGEPADLWLMLGDNAYPDGTDREYQAAVFEMYPDELRHTVLWPAVGNHDARSANPATGSGPYFDIFTLPTRGEAGGLASGTEAYYAFDYGDIHFVCLDSHGSDRSPGGAMLTWLEDDLMMTDAAWIVAFWHHPPYSKGSHDSDREGRLVEMRENVLPILESHGVDLVLAGHSHSYERSFLLDSHYGPSQTLTGPMILDSGDGRREGDGAYRKRTLAAAHGGAVYAVAGSSGRISGGPLDHPAMRISLNRLGSLILDFDGDSLDAHFIDTAGSAADTFTILKAPRGGCTETETSLCLLGGRFRVEVGWQDFEGGSGPGRSLGLGSDSGAFWFFEPSNLELVAKVLDGCTVNGAFWFFAAGLTNVGVEVVVTDTARSVSRRYTSRLGEAFLPIQSTAAFPCP